jgi:hypothetical protein
MQSGGRFSPKDACHNRYRNLWSAIRIVAPCCDCNRADKAAFIPARCRSTPGSRLAHLFGGLIRDARTA